MNVASSWLARARFAVLFLITVSSVQSVSADMLLHIGATQPRVGQRGETVEVTIQGMCLKTAQQVIFYKPGIRAVAIEPLPDLTTPIRLAHGGRIQEQIRCRFEIAPDCEPGEYPFRIRTATEITSLGTFHVSGFRVIDEQETGYNTNDSLATALVVEPSVTVRGKMGASGRGDVDLYKVPVVAGQRLSVEVDSVRIADVHYGDSEYDLAVRILDDQGRELAANDDNPLHLQDPLTAVRAPRDGFAFVEVQRSLFKPSERDYTVHIGANRRPLVVWPLGGRAGDHQTCELLGDPLGAYREKIVIPMATGTFNYFPEANSPSPLLMRSSPYRNVLESTTAPETRVPQLPAALNGRIQQRGETDAYVVSVNQGDRYRVRVFAASLGSPIDPRLRIRTVEPNNQPGVAEVEMDDCRLPDRDRFGTSFRSGGGLKDILDPSIVWEPKKTGAYRIEIEENGNAFGPMAVYRIEVEPAPNSVYPLLASTAFDWEECIRTSGLVTPRGNRWTVNVSLPQGQGSRYEGELDLIAHGLPDGVRMVSGRVPSGRTLWPVQFVAESRVEPISTLITLEAHPTDPTKKLESQSQQALPFINHSGGDAWRTVLLDRFVFSVTDAAPMSIELLPPPAALVRGGELAIPFKVKRSPNFMEPIEFQCDWIPPGVGVPPTAILAGGESEGVLRVTADANAPLGKTPLVITASTVREDLDGYLGTGRVRVSSDVVDLTIAEPFVELASQPDAIRRGTRKKFLWTVTHKSPFEGTASVRLMGLPKGVKVVEPFPQMTRDSREIEFQLEATNEALLGSVRGIACEVTVLSAGQEIRQRTGNGTLRIDPRLEEKGSP